MKTGFQRCKRVKNAHSDLRPSRLVEEQAQVSPEGGRDPGEHALPAETPITGALRNGGRWIRCRKARSPSFCSSYISTRVEIIWKVSQACGRRSGPWAAPLPHAAHLCFLFQDLDKFGNEITQLARPLPVEYLIIDVSACPPPGCQQLRWAGLLGGAA